MKLVDYYNMRRYDKKYPREVLPQGITCYCSDAGTGKSISCIEYLTRVRDLYPDVKIYTNVRYKDQDGEIKSVADMLNKRKCVFFLDEINLILRSHDWRKINPDFIYILSQHRHLGIHLITSAQSYDHICKEFRDFCTEIVEVRNWKNRWFFQRAYKREDYKQMIRINLATKEPEYVDEWKAQKRIWTNNFVATNELFSLYDSYRIIDNLIG